MKTLAQLVAFYAVHDPAKTEAEIAEIVGAWPEADMLQGLEEKYGDDPRRYGGAEGKQGVTLPAIAPHADSQAKRPRPRPRKGHRRAVEEPMPPLLQRHRQPPPLGHHR